MSIVVDRLINSIPLNDGTANFEECVAESTMLSFEISNIQYEINLYEQILTGINVEEEYISEDAYLMEGLFKKKQGIIGKAVDAVKMLVKKIIEFVKKVFNSVKGLFIRSKKKISLMGNIIKISAIGAGGAAILYGLHKSYGLYKRVIESIKSAFAKAKKFVSEVSGDLSKEFTKTGEALNGVHNESYDFLYEGSGKNTLPITEPANANTSEVGKKIRKGALMRKQKKELSDMVVELEVASAKELDEAMELIEKYKNELTASIARNGANVNAANKELNDTRKQLNSANKNLKAANKELNKAGADAAKIAFDTLKKVLAGSEIQSLQGDANDIMKQIDSALNKVGENQQKHLSLLSKLSNRIKKITGAIGSIWVKIGSVFGRISSKVK